MTAQTNGKYISSFDIHYLQAYYSDIIGEKNHWV